MVPAMYAHLALAALLAAAPATPRLKALDGKPWVVRATARGPSRDLVEPALRRTLERRLAALGARLQPRVGPDAGVTGPGGAEPSSVVATCTVEPRARGMACGFRAETGHRSAGDTAEGRAVLEHTPMMPRWQRDDAGLSGPALARDAEQDAHRFVEALLEWLAGLDAPLEE